MSVLQRHRPRESKLIANKHRILNRIFREGRCSRFYLARRLNINASTIGNYVEDFLQQGILLEDHARPTRRGRSPVPMWLNPDYGRFLGVDFEALRVRTVLTDFAGGIVAQKEVALRAGLSRHTVLKIVLDAAKETAWQAGALRVFAVGIAAPGLLDSREGRIVRYALLPDFQDVPLLEELRPHFDCPVFVEENIRALTLAEMLRGAGRGRRNFLCVAARSGIGMGIVIDGRIYTGNGGLAGKLGRTVFPRDGHPQTMTQLVSAKGIIGQAIELLKSTRKSPLRRSLLEKGDDLSLDDLVAAAESGDRSIRACSNRSGEIWDWSWPIWPTCSPPRPSSWPAKSPPAATWSASGWSKGFASTPCPRSSARRSSPTERSRASLQRWAPLTRDFSARFPRKKSSRPRP